MYAIEKNIPAPEFRSYRKYPFRDMAIGDSFHVPAEHVRFGRHTEDGRPVNRIRQVASAAGKRLGMKFQIKTLPDKSTRVWRTA